MQLQPQVVIEEVSVAVSAAEAAGAVADAVDAVVAAEAAVVDVERRRRNGSQSPSSVAS